MPVTKRNLQESIDRIESAKARILIIMANASPKVSLALHEVLERDLDEAVAKLTYARDIAE